MKRGIDDQALELDLRIWTRVGGVVGILSKDSSL